VHSAADLNLSRTAPGGSDTNGLQKVSRRSSAMPDIDPRADGRGYPSGVKWYERHRTVQRNEFVKSGVSPGGPVRSLLASEMRSKIF
jgi:hypothetical protein